MHSFPYIYDFLLCAVFRITSLTQRIEKKKNYVITNSILDFFLILSKIT